MQLSENLGVQHLRHSHKVEGGQMQGYLAGEEAAWEIMWFTLGLQEVLNTCSSFSFLFLLYLAVLQVFSQLGEDFSSNSLNTSKDIETYVILPKPYQNNNKI